ncbi:MAG: prohibitin family protein [Burkholderiales bacterium]|nr:prohibitin family protein [Burkholderiales bacterium]
MWQRVRAWMQGRVAMAGGAIASQGTRAFTARTFRRWAALIGAIGVAWGGYLLLRDAPVQGVGPGEVALRVNRYTGSTTAVGEGSVVIVPAVHELRRIPLRERTYRAAGSVTTEAPFQSVEGLSFSADLVVRYALDRGRVMTVAATLPSDVDGEIVAPRVQGVIYKVFSRYTMREIFSTKRADIQQAIETELAPLLAADGVTLRAVTIGKIELPADYRAGLERLLAEELAAEKMRYTLELKDKQVKQSELEAEAEKVRREKAAEAAGNEQMIAARAQAEAMKHVLPFKQKQIEQRQLEAQAEKVARVQAAEANAEARRIEANGEADSRRKLAEAEAYRLEVTGKAVSEQLARDGALISRNPLLIQKTMADKLSDKISVIIAPPPSDGGFIGAALLGANTRPAVRPVNTVRDTEPAVEEEVQ